HEAGVHLQRGLASGEHGEAARLAPAPLARDRFGERIGRVELSSGGAVRADEIGVAEPAHRARSVLLPPRPQVAAGEAAEHGGAPGVHALALQGVEDLLDLVHLRAFPFHPERLVSRPPVLAQLARRAAAASRAPVVRLALAEITGV